MACQRSELSSGWQFKNASDPDSSYLDVAQFPTNIHLDLLKHGKIPDPFLDTNEAAIQWVGEETWDYRTTIHIAEPLADGQRAELVFEGLDTHATVSLDGEEVLKTDNMFVHHRVDVTDKIRGSGGGGHVLHIRFDSTWLLGRAMEVAAADKPLFCHNGDSSRLQVRKAQYHYGWDWYVSVPVSLPP
jgi:beta-mannosidase